MRFYFTTFVIMSVGTSLIPLANCNSDFPCIGTCYSGRFSPEPQDVFHGKHLKGYSYKNITTDNPNKCYSSCVQDCRCKACQMQDTRCELLEEDKSSKSSDFVAASRYVYYDIRQTLYHGAYHMLPPGKCYNGCCKSQPCMNGGTCTEHCDDPKLKFSCKCPDTFLGQVCEKLTSCLSVVKLYNAEDPPKGVYNIFNTNTNTSLPIYCAFNKDARKIWYLMESHSLANAVEFNFKPFYDESFSVNSLSPPSWDRYRLSPDDIKYIRSKSTLFRATCNYDKSTSSLQNDVLFGSLSSTDITRPLSVGCQTYQRIAIRNTRSCTMCNAATFVSQTMHIHLDLSLIASIICSFAPNFQNDANYFGFHAEGQIDSSFSCTNSEQSTTQWWLGQEY